MSRLSNPSSPDSILQLRDVSYRAGGRTLLDSVCWTIGRGEHWAVLGPNGAGKTTLLRIASGYLWPNAGGEVLRLGKRLLDLGELRKSIGWVTWDVTRRIPPREPALDTVVSGHFGRFGLKRALLRDQLSDDVVEAADAHLDEVNCRHLGGQAFGTLSQGEQQKVLIARARMARPLIIFLDEPCAGLDPGAREGLLADLDALAARETRLSLVLVTHHLEEIMPSFESTLALANGQVLCAGPRDEVIDGPLVEALYGLAASELIERNGRLWPIW